jgi:hypothetical protein
VSPLRLRDRYYDVLTHLIQAFLFAMATDMAGAGIVAAAQDITMASMKVLAM